MDDLQKRLRGSHTKFLEWKELMKGRGYKVHGENAYKRVKDKSSASGYREVRVENFRGKSTSTPGDIATKKRVGKIKTGKIPKKGEVQPRTWRNPYGQQSGKPTSGKRETWPRVAQNQEVKEQNVVKDNRNSNISDAGSFLSKDNQKFAEGLDKNSAWAKRYLNPDRLRRTAEESQLGLGSGIKTKKILQKTKKPSNQQLSAKNQLTLHHGRTQSPSKGSVARNRYLLSQRQPPQIQKAKFAPGARDVRGRLISEIKGFNKATGMIDRGPIKTPFGIEIPQQSISVTPQPLGQRNFSNITTSGQVNQLRRHSPEFRKGVRGMELTIQDIKNTAAFNEALQEAYNQGTIDAVETGGVQPGTGATIQPGGTNTNVAQGFTPAFPQQALGIGHGQGLIASSQIPGTGYTPVPANITGPQLAGISGYVSTPGTSGMGPVANPAVYGHNLNIMHGGGAPAVPAAPAPVAIA